LLYLHFTVLTVHIANDQCTVSIHSCVDGMVTRAIWRNLAGGEGKLHLFVDGMGPSTKRVSGSFVPSTLHPMLGMNPQWQDRAFSGEVAFARVEHELPVPPDAFGQFAAELADVRLEV